MMSMQEQREEENSNEVEIEVEGDSYAEQLFKASIKAYEEMFNQHSTKVEAKFIVTITTHKVPRPEGNKDVAYLRLDRHTREKGSTVSYTPMLVHQEMYVFRNLKERLNPEAPWKEQLYASCIGRLIWHGLEYAEFMRRTKMIQDAEDKKTEEDRLAKLNLVKAESVPQVLSPEDEKYKEWLKAERAKEGL